MKGSQNDWVHRQLVAGRKLTPLVALKEAGIFRLGARVYELRQKGYRIKSEIVEKRGKRFAQYRTG